MSQPDESKSTVTDWVRGNMLWLLAGAFALAVISPGLGQQLRQPFSTHGKGTPVYLLLAALLFNLGLSTPFSAAWKLLNEWPRLLSSLLVRALLCGCLAVLARTLPLSMLPVITALIFTMAMPTAASSSGWCTQARASERVVLALIIGTTFASVWTAPWLLSSAGQFGTDELASGLTSLREAYSLRFVILWVLVPTILGMAAAELPRHVVSGARKVGRELNPFIILLLNYANGSSSLPQLRASLPTTELWFLVSACLGVVAAVVVFTNATGLRSANGKTKSAVLLATMMSNTGLALVVATIAMPSNLLVHLTIIVYTFVQHFAAAMLARISHANQPRSQLVRKK